MPPVNKEAFVGLQGERYRRMCLANGFPWRFLQRSRGASWVGKCSAPFMATVGPLFELGTGYSLDTNQHGVFRCVRSEKEFREIEAWVKAQGARVFMRSLLRCCVASDFTFEKPGGSRTRIGDLEYCAKRGDRRKGVILAKHLADSIKDMPCYKDARYIAAVPPLREQSFGLAARLAGHIAEDSRLIDLTARFFRRSDAPAVKGLAEGDKWDALEGSQLSLNLERPLSVRGDAVILLDDKYQSGATMHYVAMRMQEAGIDGDILGLAAVKTLGDGDNQS